MEVVPMLSSWQISVCENKRYFIRYSTSLNRGTSGKYTWPATFPNLYYLLVKFCLMFLFADDTKCTKEILSTSDSKEDLNSLFSWSIDNNLYFGLTKCVLLSLNFKPSSTYYLGDYTLITVSSNRDLGVVVSSNLSWTTQYNQILNKVYKSLGLLRRI